MRLLKQLLLLSILSSGKIIAQDVKNAELDHLAEMSIADMLKVKINVASTVPQSITQTPSVVTIIDRQTIERFSFQNIAEAIQIVAGVSILQTNLDQNVVTIRGILQNYYNNKILILINNTPVWQPIYGNGTIDRVNINDIERIEVLKGPASVLYGTNAYTGVVNIILRQKTTNTLHARIETGLPTHGSAAVNYSMQKSDFSAFISGSSAMSVGRLQKMQGAGDSSLVGKSYAYKADTSFYSIPEHRNYSFNTELKYKSHTAFINDYTNIYNYSGVNISYATGSRWPFIDKGTLAGYKFEQSVTEKLTVLINTHYDYFSRFYEQAADGSSAIHFSAGRAAAIAKFNYQITPQLLLEGGSDLQQGHSFGHFTSNTKTDTIISRNLANEHDIVEWSVFGQGNYTKHGVNLFIGSRYTGNKTFGGNVSNQVSAMYNINPQNKIKVGYAQSYRTPTMLELYFKHYTVVGNPNLKPERNNTLEASYQFNFGSMYVQATTFFAQYRDLIQRQPRPGAPAEYRNLAQFDGMGSEIEYKFMNPKIVNILLNYSHLRGVGESAESNFRFVPAHTAQVCIDRAWGAFFTSVIARGYSATKGVWADIPTQYVISSHIGYRIQNEKKIRFTHTISLENITNSQMLIPEYIRRRPNINTLAGIAEQRSLYYSLNISF